MTIKKYKALVTIEKEIEFEVNTDIINEKFFEEFSQIITSVDCVEEVLEHVAFQVAHNEGYFIEGLGEWPNRWERDKNLADQGVHIVNVEEDTDVEID